MFSDPSDPPGTPEVIDYDKNHAELAWTPPKNDGGAPITGYVIEARDKDTNKWRKVSLYNDVHCIFTHNLESLC